MANAAQAIGSRCSSRSHVRRLLEPDIHKDSKCVRSSASARGSSHAAHVHDGAGAHADAEADPEEASEDEVELHVETPERFTNLPSEGPLPVHEAELSVGGSSVHLSIGSVAPQADASVWASEGSARVLASCCVGQRQDRSGQGAMAPLQVVYSERFSGAGLTPGGFVKRDGRIKEFEVLVARLIDRSLRPVVAEAFPREVQISSTVFSIDNERLPDQLALLASSASLSLSRVPLELPAVAGVRVVVDSSGDEPRINPANVPLDTGDLPSSIADPMNDTEDETPTAVASVPSHHDNGDGATHATAEGTLPLVDLVVSGTKSGVLMVEGGADLAPKEDVLRAIESAHEEIASICEELTVLAERFGRVKETASEGWNQSQRIEEADRIVNESVGADIKEWSCGGGTTPSEKQKRGKLKEQIKEAAMDSLSSSNDGKAATIPEALLSDAFERQCKKYVRHSLASGSLRQDGRRNDDLRPISASSGRLLPNAHGSAIFTRGETQALAAVQLGSDREMQMVDSPTRPGGKPFALHYFFPPLSVGETGRLSGTPSRREVGHGALAERGLKPIAPSKTTFGHNIRIESTITSSNGSSSMASVSVGTLALLDAGVPIKQPVAGVAIGMVKVETNPEESTLLVDILGSEDFMGDMDFKVAGGGDGTISAVQLDVKTATGLQSSLFRRAIDLADDAVARVIATMMAECTPPPSCELADGVDRTIAVRIDPENVGKVIGIGGQIVNSIRQRTGAKTIFFDSSTGYGTIRGPDSHTLAKAHREVLAVAGELNEGVIFYDVEVLKVPDYGLIIELAPETKALVHVGTLGLEYGQSATEYGVQAGDHVDVKISSVSEKGYKAEVLPKTPNASPATAA